MKATTREKVTLADLNHRLESAIQNHENLAVRVVAQEKEIAALKRKVQKVVSEVSA